MPGQEAVVRGGLIYGITLNVYVTHSRLTSGARLSTHQYQWRLRFWPRGQPARWGQDPRRRRRRRGSWQATTTWPGRCATRPAARLRCCWSGCSHPAPLARPRPPSGAMPRPGHSTTATSRPRAPETTPATAVNAPRFPEFRATRRPRRRPNETVVTGAVTSSFVVVPSRSGRLAVARRRPDRRQVGPGGPAQGRRRVHPARRLAVPAGHHARTALSSNIFFISATLSWVCVGIHRCGALPFPVCAYNWPIWC